MVFFRICFAVAALSLYLLSSYAQEATEIKPRLTLKGHNGGVVSVAFHPDGKTLASGGVDKTVKLWDLATGKNIATLKGHKNFVDCVAFSSDGKNLASVSRDSIRWWDCKSQKNLATYLGRSRITESSFGGARSLVVRPDGKAVIWGAPWRVTLWEVGNDAEKEVTKSDAKLAWFYIFNLPGMKIWAANITPPNIEVWNLLPAKKISTLKGRDNNVYCVTFSPDEKTLVSANSSENEVVRLWDLGSGMNIATYKQPGRVVSLAYSQNGKVLALCYIVTRDWKKGPIRLLHAATGKELALLNTRGRPSGLVFSPDSRTLASWGDQITLWDVSAFTKPKK